MINPTTPSEQLLFNTVRIEVKTKDGSGTGTGFFFMLKVAENRHMPLIVTNKHVVKGAEFGSFFLHEAEIKDRKQIPSGRSFKVDIGDFEKKWIGHPDNDVGSCIAA